MNMVLWSLKTLELHILLKGHADVSDGTHHPRYLSLTDADIRMYDLVLEISDGYGLRNSKALQHVPNVPTIVRLKQQMQNWEEFILALT